ncbi:sal-like protein 1 [Lampetra planeri]
MSRRKQTKPQQHFGESGEGGPDSSESACSSALNQSGGDGGSDKSSPRAHVCDSCCGQFPTVAALGQHMESCGKAPAVFIVEESDKVPPDDGSPGNGIGVLREGFPVAVAVAVPNGDGKTKAPHFPNDSPPPLEGSKRFRADSSGSVGGHAVTSSSSGGGGGKGKVNGYSSSEALEVGRSEKAAAAGGNKVAMSGAAASLPFIVEQLVSLHQQQMNQLHLIEQIRSQVTLMVAASSAAAAAAAASIPMRLNHAAKMTTTMAPLGRPQPIHVATSSVSAATNYIQGGSLVSAMSSPGILPSFGTMTTSSPGLVYPILTRLPHGVVPFQSQHGEPALSHGSRHRRNRHLSERKAGGEEVSAAAASSAAMAAVSFIKNKCRYCGKVFGSDSALQIHLRSHTGERPFKCNICGSRFTTRGNLKVHFQRHKEQYPDISMNPHPVAEHLDNVVTKSGLPYGMSISAEESAAVRENDKIAYPPLKPSDDGAFGIGGIGGGDKLSSVKVERGMGQGGRDDETAVSFATSTNYMFYNKMNSLSNSEASAHVSRANFEERLRSDFSYGSGGGGFPDPRRRSETSKLEQLVQSLEERGLPGGSAGAPGDDGAGVGAVPNQCGVCHRVLSCPSALKVHMRTHTGERPHKCKVCGRAYTTKANLVLHYAVHRGKPAVRALHSCPICQKQFTNAMVLQQHIRMHMGGQIGGSGNESEGGPPSAPGYATAVASPEAVETTRVVAAAAAPAEDEEETGDRYAGERNRPAEEAASYLSGDNMETAEGGSADGENRDADDDEEEFADARDTSFTEGAAEPGPSFSQGPSPPGSVSSDASTGKKPKSGLLNFSQESFNGITEGDASSQDGTLSFKYGEFSRMDFSPAPSSAASLSNGSTNDHRLKLLALVGLGEGFNPIKTESNAEGSNDGMADQSQENGSFRSFSPYDQSKGKATTCDICGKRFPYQSALDIHYRSHTKVRPFICPICNRGCTTKSNLKQHILTHRKGYSAEFLGQSLEESVGSGTGLVARALSLPGDAVNGFKQEPPSVAPPSEGESPSPGQALGLGLGMGLPRGFLQSLVSPRSSSTPPFTSRRSSKQHNCPVCGKNYSSASALQIHSRTHTGEKPYACSVCGRAFTTKGNLKVHMTTHMWNSVPVRRGRRLSAELHPCLLDSAVPPPSSSDASDSNAATGEDGVAGSSNADGGGGSIVVKHPPPPPPPPPPHHLGHFPPDVFSAGPHASGHRSGSDPNFWIQYAALLANGLAVPPPPLLPPPPPPQPQPLLPPSLPMSSAMVGAVPAVGGGGGVAGASAGGGGGGGVGIGLGGGSSCGSSSSGSSGSAKVNEISVIQNVAVPGTPPRFGGGVGGEGDEHEEAAAMERMVSEGEAAHRYARFMDADKELA